MKRRESMKKVSVRTIVMEGLFKMSVSGILFLSVAFLLVEVVS
jgi:hypothetical protein